MRTMISMRLSLHRPAIVLAGLILAGSAAGGAYLGFSHSVSPGNAEVAKRSSNYGLSTSRSSLKLPHTGYLAAQGVPTYPTNGLGESYGSAMGAMSLAQEPDLIAVAATNGQDGYVLKSQLDAASGADISTPAQAIAWDKDGAYVSHTIPVYEENGTTVIGSYTIEASTPPTSTTVPAS